MFSQTPPHAILYCYAIAPLSFSPLTVYERIGEGLTINTSPIAIYAVWGVFSANYEGNRRCGELVETWRNMEKIGGVFSLFGYLRKSRGKHFE